MLNDNDLVHSVENLFEQSSKVFQGTFINKSKIKKDKVQFNSNETSDNFLNMLQKNIKLNHENIINGAFHLLNQPNDISEDDINFSSTTKEVYQPENLFTNQSNYSNDYSSDSSKESDYKNYSDLEMDHQNVENPPTINQKITNKKNKSIKKLAEQSVDKPQRIFQDEIEQNEIKQKSLQAKITKELPQTKTIEEILPNNEENTEQVTDEAKHQNKSMQMSNELFSKIKKSSNIKINKTTQKLEGIETLSNVDKENKKQEKITSSKIKSRSFRIEKNSNVEETQIHQLNVQKDSQSVLQDERFSLEKSKKLINQIATLNDKTKKSSSSTRNERSFSQISSGHNRIQGSGFSKLLQSSVLKNQLSDQFQSMLHRSKILIKDQKNVFLNTKLRPKELGTVSLKLSMLDGNINALFTVENEVVQKLIAERMDKMLSELREGGYQVESFNVNVKSDGHSNHNNSAQNKNKINKKVFFQNIEDDSWGEKPFEDTGELYA